MPLLLKCLCMKLLWPLTLCYLRSSFQSCLILVSSLGRNNSPSRHVTQESSRRSRPLLFFFLYLHCSSLWATVLSETRVVLMNVRSNGPDWIEVSLQWKAGLSCWGLSVCAHANCLCLPRSWFLFFHFSHLKRTFVEFQSGPEVDCYHNKGKPFVLRQTHMK